MQSKQKSICTLLVLFLSIFLIHAQQSTISSGGKASSSDGSVSYSVGQTVYTTNRSNVGSVAQGIQQPFEISVVSGIDEKTISLECSIYPNPTTDFLRLKTQDDNVVNLSYQLFDSNGIQLISKKVKGNDTEISLQKYQSGTYFIKVIKTQSNRSPQEIKSFKIIKK